MIASCPRQPIEQRRGCRGDLACCSKRFRWTCARRSPRSSRRSAIVPEPAHFRFRPRYRAMALSALGIGGTLVGISLVVLGAPLLPLVTGAAGMVLGAGYLL